jgi:hypothetical protein
MCSTNHLNVLRNKNILNCFLKLNLNKNVIIVVNNCYVAVVEGTELKLRSDCHLFFKLKYFFLNSCQMSKLRTVCGPNRRSDADHPL